MAQTAVTDLLAESFVINGGQPLNGRVTAAGNKNGALPILAACLLTSEPVVLHNVPRIRDVETMIALIGDLGADVEWSGENEVRVHAADLGSHELDAELLRALVDVVAVDSRRERRLLQLFLDGLRLECLDPVRANEPACVDEPAELVAGEEGLLELRVPGKSEMRRM